MIAVVSILTLPAQLPVQTMAEYKCHTCCKVDPPRPLPNELPGTTLWSTCDHCGPAYHHINCLPQEYRAAATARAIENPSEDSLSQDNEPPLTCKCYRCLDRLSQDPFNLKQTDQQVISECWAAAGNALKSARKTLDRLQAPAAPATPAAAALPATPATPAAAALPATPANRNRSRTTAKKKGKDSGSMVVRSLHPLLCIHLCRATLQRLHALACHHLIIHQFFQIAALSKMHL